MIRFRNPGTSYLTQIQVLKLLYNALGKQEYFTLDDMLIVLTKGKLMTAYGYAGEEAIKLSNTEQESMNSVKMNAKMYAEVFRMLGWVSPYNSNSSYPLVFTYIGIHIALSDGDCSQLYEQCVLGINNPNQLTDRMSYVEKVRFFKCVLRTFIDLGGIMYKHELCLGPMSVNDLDEDNYVKMIAYIKSIRGRKERLVSEFEKLCKSLNMKHDPVDNCTRLPIALLKSCNLVESVSDTTLYGSSMSCLRITVHGIQLYNELKNMYDLRLDEFLSYDEEQRAALIRLGVYGMLERSGYDISTVIPIIEDDKMRCASILNGKELLFSPYQTLRAQIVDKALGIKRHTDSQSELSIKTFESLVSERHSSFNIQELDLNVPDRVISERLVSNEDLEFLKVVDKLKALGLKSNKIVDSLFDYYRSATQTLFYPLVATLFKIIGFDCSFSRPGDNGARWDAIIEDHSRSIPIEIKSPTEESHLSVKAIRQALENKIILLSRKTFNTLPDVCSLAVGYYMPNERAEVNNLILDIKLTYGYKIGVIDLHSLLSMAISVLIDGIGIDKERIYSLEGLINANIQ